MIAKRKIHNLVKFKEWAKINIEGNLDIKLPQLIMMVEK